ncbi:hypothetical protein F444_11413 [Phytophthora nicotianae P1976]|uniref:Uncharacterized protein n=1 Tax=Phytophthora nicotianae P1976 TaxID=1317066 RepID=A0A081A0I7_PHYNI|nr:hypothetical protein F444_11413 [Phytophthora nicotianae P1976]
MTPASQIKTPSMPRRPKNKNKKKYKIGMEASSKWNKPECASTILAV